MRRLFPGLTPLFLLLLATPALAQKEFGFDNRKPSGQPYLTPEETVKRFKVAPEFEVKLFAGEPQVINPVAFTIDERGRVWVVECFEYPSRTPKGKAPRDRIVILEDTDGDGVCDKRTVFAEGKDFPVPEERKKAGLGAFDLASGIEVGNGGVYVGAPPYLWFIENKNDKPGKYETLLSGFGSQDTHEMLNTFQWGPDGWLYGLHGVFTLSAVKPLDGPETRMNAAVWRYHPQRKTFEIFAEGTSNPWGMDWRNTDGQFILACCVIPHLFHIVPGGVYKRQAGAHSNPYAYGQINEICDHTFHKESGWAHAGLISLDAPHIPEKYRNSVIFGSIHGCSVKQNILKPNGSTYTASRGDDFLVSGDKNVRPINMKWGPLGDIYLIDWHDQNPCHQAAADSWDYERGRVYRIQLKGTQTKKAKDIGNATSKELAEYLKSDNPYEFRTSLRLTNERVQERESLKSSLGQDEGFTVQKEFKPLPAYARPLCLTTLPALTVRSALIDRAVLSGRWFLASEENFRRVWEGFDRYKSEEAWALTIRRWADEAENDLDALRFLCEKSGVRNIPQIARREFASAAIRLAGTLEAGNLIGAEEVGDLIHNLMAYKEDASDPVIPHLVWIAYEKVLVKKAKKADEIEAEFAWLTKKAVDNPFVRDQIVPKVMRRFVATGRPADLARCLKFVADVKDVDTREKALGGLVVALNNQTVAPPDGSGSFLAELRQDARLVPLVNKLAVNFRDPAALNRAYDVARDAQSPPDARAEAVRQVVLLRHPEALALIGKIVRENGDLKVRAEAARQLAAIDSPKVGEETVRDWAQFPKPIRGDLVNSLASRKEWARALLRAMADKKIERTEVTDNTILRIQAFNDKDLNALIEKAWGRTRPTPKELDALIARMRGELAAGPASFARGKVVFDNQCAKCHKFDGRGADVGPPLDGAARDVEYILANVIDPNRVIGAPYFLRTVTTVDGRVEQGLLAEEDDQSVTLKVEQSVLKKFAKKDLDGPVKVQEKSMMPEGLTAGMSVQDFRDLVCYVMAHPYVTVAAVDGKPATASVTGRIALPVHEEISEMVIEAEVTAAGPVKTQLLVGAPWAFAVKIDGKEVGRGKTDKPAVPNEFAFPVELTNGPHKVTITAKYKSTNAAAYVRFQDPERKLSYPAAK
ncbi:PVC-type heme-binding CxxCH protein [Fimbriiglobus ruber]|uniref:Cytochrome c domain-containing protein n=1 Tax=Fimbriiglobus ruber TaxID=1908690 RepID=A0A225D5A1_9BACT|nr:PVC-type heme-binding CxxCH protein [Fimbriiglobus ruber]OWK36133.1 hypothetical protein FRUB_08696 [Fimbriiglobus ruber]